LSGLLQRDALPGNLLDQVEDLMQRMKALETNALTVAPPEYVVNLAERDAARDGVTDVTEIFQAAFDEVFSHETGGTLYVPYGSYVATGLDFHEDVANFNKSVRIVGAGYQASKIILNTTGIGIDCIGAYGLQFDNLQITSGTNAPTVGVLFSRSTTSNTCGAIHMKDVWVWGNFTQACVANIGAEGMTYDTCVFNNTNADGGVGFFLSNYAAGVKLDGASAYESFTIASALGTIYESSNTNIRFKGCDFLGYGTENIPLSIESAAQATFTGCAFMPTENGAPCVLISDIQSTPFNGPVDFFGCLFEGDDPTNGIELYSTRSNPSFSKINVIGDYFNLYGTGQFALTYAGTWTGTMAIYGLIYQGNAQAGTLADVVRVDYAEDSTIDMPNGELQAYTGFNKCQIRADVYTFLRSVELMSWSNTTRELWSAAKPVSGVYFIGERIYNSDPAGTEFIGWVAALYDGGAFTGARANTTSYANGIWLTYSDYSVWEKTAGTGTTAGSEPDITSTDIGDTVVDGDFTMTKRANSLTYLKGFGAIEA